jgi:hypothetical protein
MLLNTLLEMIDKESLPYSRMYLKARVETFKIDFGMVSESFYEWLRSSEIVTDIECSGVHEGVAHDVSATFNTPDGQLELVDCK